MGEFVLAAVTWVLLFIFAWHSEIKWHEFLSSPQQEWLAKAVEQQECPVKIKDNKLKVVKK